MYIYPVQCLPLPLNQQADDMKIMCTLLSTVLLLRISGTRLLQYPGMSLLFDDKYISKSNMKYYMYVWNYGQYLQQTKKELFFWVLVLTGSLKSSSTGFFKTISGWLHCIPI